MSDNEQGNETNEVISVKQDKDLVPTEVMVTLVAPSFRKTYDGRPLEGSRTGLNQVQAFGLPNDYTVEATTTGSQTDAGMGVNLINEDYVIRDANGEDRTVDFPNVTLMSGTLTVVPRPLTILTGGASKAYDGVGLQESRTEVRGLVRGESVTLEATGFIDEVGRVLNNCAITWSGAKPSNYVVTRRLGYLEITPSNRRIVLTAASAQKVYDGQPLTQFEVSSSGLPEGFTLEARAFGSQIDCGNSANAVEKGFQILNAEGEDRTKNFTNIELVEGVLTVTPRPVTITTGSDTIPYDGMELTSEKADISGLVEGESVTLTTTGSITEIGTAPNTYYIAWDNAKAINYQVTEELGQLTVTENSDSIVLTAASLSKTYDGKPLQAGEGGVMVTGLVEGFRVEAWTSGSQLDVGTSFNQVDKGFRILNAEGYDRTENFVGVTLVDGRLTVNRRAITIRTGSSSKAYDGQPLTDPTVVIEGLAEGDSVSIRATGTITDVGTAPNTYEITWDNAWPENYAVTENLGFLTVTENRVPRRFR